MANNAFQMLANFARQHGNPQVLNSPMGKAMLEALESGDASKGSQLAENYLSGNNMTKEEGISSAKSLLQSFIGGQK